MLIITSLAAAAALAVSPAAAGADATPSPPPMVVTVATTMAAITPSLVSRVLEEVDAIWRPSGVVFAWRREPHGAATRLDQLPAAACVLRIEIGNRPGSAHGGRTPLGWILFDNGSPAPEIYLSYQNAFNFFASAPEVVGPLGRMPPLEIEIKLARAMGRALAHELGHYLFASKEHTPRGLMQASHTAYEFFDYSRRGFEIDLDQRQLIAARLHQDGVVVSR